MKKTAVVVVMLSVLTLLGSILFSHDTEELNLDHAPIGWVDSCANKNRN